MAKRRKSGAKRTISEEQQAKMQAGRKRAAENKKKVSQLYASGLAVHENLTHTQRMLNSVRRKG